MQKWIRVNKLFSLEEASAKPEKIDQQVDKNIYLGTNLDGSSGLCERREHGRFGSLSSFDNYGDEYNERDDSQLNGS